jgi:hypothetical protein
MAKFITEINGYLVDRPDLSNLKEEIDLSVIFVDYNDEDWEKTEIEILEVTVIDNDDLSDTAKFLGPILNDELREDAELKSYLHDNLHNLKCEPYDNYF